MPDEWSLVGSCHSQGHEAPRNRLDHQAEDLLHMRSRRPGFYCAEGTQDNAVDISDPGPRG